MQNTDNFERQEKKYRLQQAQFDNLIKELSPYILPDRFPHVLVQNLYYDTPYYDLISTSLQKPIFKEKLRIRRYGAYLSDDDEVFAEIKKKYKGVVYKRRAATTLAKAMALMTGQVSETDTQIEKEIASTASHYRDLAPKMFLSYMRLSFVGRKDRELRLTFDYDIRYDSKDVHFGKGDKGVFLLPKGTFLLEIKSTGGYPLWLVDILSRNGIYPVSFSKYGTAFMADAETRKQERK